MKALCQNPVNGWTVRHINHVELTRKAYGPGIPPSLHTDPIIYRGVSGGFIAPWDNIPIGEIGWSCDTEGEIAIITDDVPLGMSAEAVAEHIKLIVICNDISLRGLIPEELGKGFGFV